MELFYVNPDTNLVHHVQAVNNNEPHITTFYWIPHTLILKWMEAVFDKVEIITEDKTHIYVCRKGESK